MGRIIRVSLLEKEFEYYLGDAALEGGIWLVIVVVDRCCRPFSTLLVGPDQLGELAILPLSCWIPKPMTI